MTWQLSDRISLGGEGIKAADAERQAATASEILRRFDERPGVILADEVGMGKTFVALAVAASVIEATGRRHPVVVMVPRSVSEKWPTEWEKFARQLGPGPELRATAEPVRSAAEFLKLLDDPEDRRNHLIVMTHGALTSSLSDPYMKLAILWFAFRKRRLKRQRERFPRWAASIIPNLRLDEDAVDALLSTQPQRWREVLAAAGYELDDDPVATSIIEALRKVDLEPMVETLLHHLPLASSSSIDDRLKMVRGQLQRDLSVVWKQCLHELDIELPLLILDEAHHTKNAGTRLAGLFANEAGADADAEALRGELGEMFDRMLFLTATPFQLGHNELIEVLRRFCGIRWADLDRAAYEEHLTQLGVALDAAQRAAQAESLIANVRLANGAVRAEQRQRLMRTFNTPFFPDVLVASSVMAEGVDLHLHCRHVIHHDLDWNPSTIEQRTGRLDRMRSKGEVTGKPVVVYEPFVEGTQDEKMFRVMKDRERWFNVVMGERLELDEANTDRIAARVPFPEAAAAGLAMDLSVWRLSEA
ncbi:MAG: helicase-related protein [Acidimicrobiales bacterium]